MPNAANELAVRHRWKHRCGRLETNEQSRVVGLRNTFGVEHWQNQFGTTGEGRQTIQEGTGKMQEGAAKMQEGLSRAASSLRGQAEHKIDQATQTAQDYYERARERADEAKSAVQERMENAQAMARAQTAGFERAIRSNVEARPLMTVAVALGVGWVIGRMMHS